MSIAAIAKKHELADDRSINMTPMIDVVFQLILFFMLISSLAKPSQIELNLPESSTGKRSQQDRPVMVSYRLVGGRPELALNGKKISGLDVLGKELKAVAPPDKPLDLEIDRNMLMQNSVNLWDALRTAGFAKYSINVVSPSRKQ